VYLLLSDPSLQRLDGVYVRGQCEAFIALAITAAVALTSASSRQGTHWVLAGVAFGVAV
jgi:hypothetical protein